MGATDALREDHRQIQRLGDIVRTCHERLAEGRHIPLDDIGRITRIIDGFLDTIHYAREENAYFPCVAGYGSLNKDIRSLLIEHEFSRRISGNISKYLRMWQRGKDCREPVARYLKTYHIYLKEHMQREEKFFDAAEELVLSPDEEREMYERFLESGAADHDSMLRDLAYLEGRPWLKE